MCTPLRVALQRYSSSLRMALQERLFRSKAAAQPQPRLAASRPQYNGKCMLFRRARYGYSLRSAAAAQGPCDARRTALDTQQQALRNKSIVQPSYRIHEGKDGPTNSDPAADCYRLLSPSWEPIIGESRQTQKLRRQVQQASGLPRSQGVVLMGEVGSGLVELAAAIHAAGLPPQACTQPLAVMDCASPAGHAGALQLLSRGLHTSSLAAAAGRDAVLAGALEGGTLLLDNLHQASCALLDLVQRHISRPAASKTAAAGADAFDSTANGYHAASGTRLLMITQQQLTGLHGAFLINVAPLRQRSGDIQALAEHYALEAATLRGWTAVQLTPAALRRLTSYAFPGNQQELHALVFRAVMLHPAFAETAAAFEAVGSASRSGSPGLKAARLAPCAGSCSSSPTPGCDGAAEAAPGSCCSSPDSNGSGNGNGHVSRCSRILLLDEGDFWAATAPEDRARLDILAHWPWLKWLLLDTSIWPEGINALMKVAFPLVIATLFLGPQDREHNAALTVFWAGWWPLVLLSYHFVGRAWCAVCPFMLYGREAQQLVDKASYEDPASPAGAPALNSTMAAAASGAGGAGVGTFPLPAQDIEGGGGMSALGASVFKWAGLWQLSKWPSELMSRWGGWFIAAAFAGILVWEEVWDLPNTAYMSGWLLLLITGGAVACSVLFERRLWCRYLCPIGGMNGLFAKLSMTEIRSRQQICSAMACSRYCHKGREVPGPLGGGGADQGAAAAAQEALPQIIPGCPLNSYPARNRDNHDCIMCASCLRACPNGSAQWRLRPPAADLWTNHGASWSELSLMFVLLGAVVLHKLPELCTQLGLSPAMLEDQTTHLLLSGLLLAAPLPTFWVADLVGRAATGQLKAPGNSVSWTSAPLLVANSSNGSSGSAAGVGADDGGDCAYRTQEMTEADLPPFVTMAYAFLPLVWAGTLAYYEPLLMTELGSVLPRLALTFSAPEALAQLLPVLGPASVDVVAATQGVTLTLGAVLSLVLTGQLAPGTSSTALVPQRVTVLALVAELWHLLV